MGSGNKQIQRRDARSCAVKRQKISKINPLCSAQAFRGWQVGMALAVLFTGIASPAWTQASLSGEISAFSGVFFNVSGSFKAGDYFQPSVRLKFAPSYASGALTLKGELTSSISLEDTAGYATSMKLGEVYATVDVAEGLSLTAGSKIISWGTALVANPEGFINPVDSLSQLVSENRSDWLLPVPLASAKYIKVPFSLEVVALPFFWPSTLPVKNSRWYPTQLAALDAKNGLVIPASLPSFPGATFTVNTTPTEPALNIGTMQGAGRAGLSLGSMDFGFSGWYGYTKTPAFDVTTTLVVPISINITANYKRQVAIGMDMSATVLDSSVLWLESALSLPEYYIGTESSSLPVAIEKNTLKSAFGMDRIFSLGEAGDLYGALEGNLTWILDYDSRLASAAKETGLGATLVTEYRSLSQDFTMRLVVMEPDFFTVDTTKQYLIRVSMKAKLTDGYSLGAGLTLFNGTGGTIGQYADNDFAYVAVTASF